MRKLALFLSVLILLALLAVYYPAYVEEPVKDGPGPLSVYVSARYTAPEYHSPLDYWQTHHMDVLNRGDISQADCLYCHDVQRSCNNCHSYVGAKAIVK